MLVRHLAGYRAAGVRYVLTPPHVALPKPRGAFTLVSRSPSAWIYRLSHPAPYFDARHCRVRADGRRRARLACAQPSVLMRREIAVSGWSAQVDGRDAAVRRRGPIFQSVAVPRGTHEVTFGYRPPHIWWSLPALAAGLLGLLWCGWFRLWRTR